MGGGLMLRIFICVLILGLFAGASYADVYVIYDPETREVVSAINKDNAVLEEGLEKAVLPGKLKDYGLKKHPTYYKFIDGDFIQNNDKISEENYKMDKQGEEILDMLLINSRIIKIACESLEADGVNFKTIKCSDY